MFSTSSLKTRGLTLIVAAVIAVALTAYTVEIQAKVVATAATLGFAKAISHFETTECITSAQFSDGISFGGNQRNVLVTASVRPRVSKFKQAGYSQGQRLSDPDSAHAIAIRNVETLQYHTG